MKKTPVKYRALGVSIAVSCLVIAGTGLFHHQFTSAVVVQQLILPLLRLIGFISIGLLAGQTIEFFGWTRQLAVVARPLFTFSKIGHHGSAAFTTAFFSGAAANAMLLEFYKNGKIAKVQLFLSNYMNHLPAFFLHLPTTMFIVLPLTGKAGALYFLLTFLATVLRVILCLVFGKIFLRANHKNDVLPANPRKKAQFTREKLADLTQKIQASLPRRIIKILIWVIPIYAVVFSLSFTGCFDALNRSLSRHIALQFMPVESLSVVILSFAAEFTSGFAAAGALLNAGVLTVKQTVIALLLGNVLAFPIRALRHQLPRYMGIFSPALGLQLLLSGQLFRITSLVFVGILYYLTVSP